jgi:iron(III) transport system substrate-binding protein
MHGSKEIPFIQTSCRRITMRRRLVGAAVITALLCTTAACGSDDDSDASSASTDAAAIYAEYGTMSPEEREADLLELAKEAGGNVTIYTDFSNQEPVTEAFAEAYDLEVTFYAPDNETLLQKILQEEEAGRHTADVVDSAYPFVTEVDDNDLLYRGWEPAANFGEPASPGWAVTRYVAFATSWNTDEVSESDLPESIEGLADPKWAGKMAMEIGDYDWYASILKYLEDNGSSADEAQEIMQQIADNSTPAKGHTAIAQQIISKETLISPTTYIQNIIEQQPAPIAWQSESGAYVAPVVLGPCGIGLMNNAPNPAGALLYADFIMSPEGQQALKDAGSTPGDLSLGGLDDVTTVTPPVEEILADDTYLKAYEELLGTS